VALLLDLSPRHGGGFGFTPARAAAGGAGR
jgi:hypothetical protein